VYVNVLVAKNDHAYPISHQILDDVNFFRNCQIGNSSCYDFNGLVKIVRDLVPLSR
jgi:hypothetical protein